MQLKALHPTLVCDIITHSLKCNTFKIYPSYLYILKYAVFLIKLVVDRWVQKDLPLLCTLFFFVAIVIFFDNFISNCMLFRLSTLKITEKQILYNKSDELKQGTFLWAFFCRKTTILISRDILIVTDCFDHNGTFVTLLKMNVIILHIIEVKS